MRRRQAASSQLRASVHLLDGVGSEEPTIVSVPCSGGDFARYFTGFTLALLLVFVLLLLALPVLAHVTLLLLLLAAAFGPAAPL